MLTLNYRNFCSIKKYLTKTLSDFILLEQFVQKKFLLLLRLPKTIFKSKTYTFTKLSKKSDFKMTYVYPIADTNLTKL